MDLLILVVVLLLLISMAALMLARRGRTQQAARTEQQYGQKPAQQEPAVRLARGLDKLLHAKDSDAATPNANTHEYPQRRDDAH